MEKPTVKCVVKTFVISCHSLVSYQAYTTQIPSKYLAYTTSGINTLVSVSVNEAAKHQGLPGENRHASSS